MTQALQKAMGYAFNNISLLERALTHSSYINEHGDAAEHNERLEFLGDAALELCISSELYARFPDSREGELTRMRASLVSQPALAALALDHKIDKYLRLGKGEESQGGRTRAALLCDAFEAVLGAAFLDGGFPAIRQVVHTLFSGKWPQKEIERVKDCKSLLQELTQRRFKDRPVYALTGSSGPEHAKTFSVQVALPNGLAFMSSGPSVKRAEQLVAGQALEFLLANPAAGAAAAPGGA